MAIRGLKGCVGIPASRRRVTVAGPRCEDWCGPLAAGSVSWLVPTILSRGQAIRVGLTFTRRSRRRYADPTGTPIVTKD
jgi:hypothetical protein